jgi:multiple sugar transport system substrate-binding protein
MKRLLLQVAGCLACLTLAQAANPVEITYWDFFGGGDGIRMKQIVEEFNKSQQDVRVTQTTLTWGEPFYTKVHTAVVAGQTPDIMSYHLSHFPAGIAAKDLRPITPEELSQAGLKASDFQQSVVERSLEASKKYGQSEQLFGVPLDIHTLVLYYNKNILEKAGALDPEGKPKGLENIDSFKKMLGEVKEKARLTPIAFSTAPADQASTWRAWYTFFKQLNGDFLKDGQLSFENMPNQGKKALQTIVDLAESGLLTKNTAYPAMVALFSSGRSAFMINGNWEVPTLVDLQTKGKLPFDYGIVAFPKLFDNPDTWGDSHQLAIPNNAKTPPTPEKVAAALKFIAYVVKQPAWAGGGHIPAYLPLQESDVYKQMQPNSQYSAAAAEHVVLEPVLPIFGVGSPSFGAVGNFLIPTINGQMPVDKGIAQFTAELENFAKKQQ